MAKKLEFLRKEKELKSGKEDEKTGFKYGAGTI